ncbi:hypothetical protein CYMTET_8522 [Cymbomonas tetramitiformis]|uniref:Uncharacterized protein n=1 Tax=Cymbomonas tetramitiformis TaxID=36881 RepID=A0AAE0LGE2_9CHLO|nr:hypothetical protein CYMTET_8522 [Cymbomonas tetramitiformis]
MRGKEQVEWKVRRQGLSREHHQWRTRKDLEHGGPLRPLREFEKARLEQKECDRQVVENRRRQRSRDVREGQVSLLDLETSGDLEDLRDDEVLPQGPPLPTEYYDEETDAYVAEAHRFMAYIQEGKTQKTVDRPPRILVLFSCTGSVEKAFRETVPGR